MQCPFHLAHSGAVGVFSNVPERCHRDAHLESSERGGAWKAALLEVVPYFFILSKSAVFVFSPCTSPLYSSHSHLSIKLSSLYFEPLSLAWRPLEMQQQGRS